MENRKLAPQVNDEWLSVTLSSIGDAVITTDTTARVTFLNRVAESLTGWRCEEAFGAPLGAVFNIVKEETRAAVENPATRALREGRVVGLANHTLLLAKDGAERAIDDSAAPIRGPDGKVVGVVLVFRDITERRNAERALQESEERFRSLVEGVRDYAIFTLDPNGIVTSWNAGAEHIKGYKAEEIVGRHLSNFYPPDAIATDFPDRELATAAMEGRFEDEGWRIRKDGSRFWASVVITAIHDAAGRLTGFSKITRDLTERKAAEDAIVSREARLKTVMRTANDAIILADDNGRIVSWNKAATDIFGYEEGDVLGGPLTLLMPRRFRHAHTNGIKRLQTTGESKLIGTTVELNGRKKNGTEFPIELSLASWRTDKEEFYTGIVRDISQRKQHEEQMREMERAQVQADAIADLNRRKDEFLAMLSHELRNPLSPILNAAQLLQLTGDDQAVRKQATSIIERQVHKLTSLIDELLDVSRISTGRFVLNNKQIDLRGVVDQAVKTIEPLVAQRKQRLTVRRSEHPIWVDGDPGRLTQVVVNLLTNAVKFTHDDGSIQLDVRSDDGDATVRVSDTGIGIEPKLLPTVFDLFTQAEQSLDRAQGGLGIGLSVVRRIVEMHGGTVEAFSEGIGHGAEFVARLPLAPPAKVPAKNSLPKPAALTFGPLRVLVVDDNKDAADTTALLLRQAGHDVEVAYSGETALVAASEFHPNAVLLDIGLPVIDGIEVARRFRQSEELKHMQLIAVTGYGEETELARSQEVGFDAFLLKPVDPQSIEDALAATTSSS